jgi:hypothetical protein
MARQHTRPERPSHTRGVHRGEEWVKHDKEPGRERSTPTARSSTGINASKRAPIDPRMPHLPPA